MRGAGGTGEGRGAGANKRRKLVKLREYALDTQLIWGYRVPSSRGNHDEPD